MGAGALPPPPPPPAKSRADYHTHTHASRGTFTWATACRSLCGRARAAGLPGEWLSAQYERGGELRSGSHARAHRVLGEPRPRGPGLVAWRGACVPPACRLARCVNCSRVLSYVHSCRMAAWPCMRCDGSEYARMGMGPMESWCSDLSTLHKCTPCYISMEQLDDVNIFTCRSLSILLLLAVRFVSLARCALAISIVLVIVCVLL